MSDDDTRAQIEALLARVDELESRAALRDLVSDYCHGFDKRDWKLFASLWHANAVWDAGLSSGPVSGRANIVATAADMSGMWRQSHHMVSNLKLTFKTRDKASGVCTLDCMGATGDDTVQMAGGTYHDDFERRSGVWKIARRRIEMHYFNPIPGAEMSAP